MNWFKSKNTDLSDAELLQRIKKEPSGEWASILFSRYIEMIYGVSLKYYKDSERSKDATMSIYEKYTQKVQTHNIDNFKSWLYVLVKNDCLEKLRKSSREREKIKQDPFMQSEVIFHPYDEDNTEETLTHLEECIKGLKEDQKKCIELFYLEKKSYQEITDLMKLEWKKVRSLIQNGRRNLKICIESK